MDPSCRVQNGCRVCGERLSRYKVSYDCHTTDNQAKLKSIGVIVANDQKDIHPERFCHGCYSVCMRTITARREGRDYTARLTKFDWGAGESSCEKPRKVGWKPKKATFGRPPNSIVQLVSSIKDRAPPSLLLDLEVREKLSRHPSMNEDLKCPVCHLVLDRPLQLTTCNIIICMACCVGHIYKQTDLCCPCGGGHTIDGNSIITAPVVIQRLLGSIEFPCQKCHEVVPAGIHKILRKFHDTY